MGRFLLDPGEFLVYYGHKGKGGKAMKSQALRCAALLLALALLLGACAFGTGTPAGPVEGDPKESLRPESVPLETAGSEATQGRIPAPDRDGYYYDVKNVVLYLEAYGRLPDNYITKNEARALGWEGGSVENYLEGAAIGGDRFGNYEGLLPDAEGRTWTECDIDTLGYGSRGSRRLVFSNDGLYYYTADHYESFSPVTVTADGDVRW